MHNHSDYDWLVVGAGFTGAVLAERIAKELDQRVLVIDRRPHPAGNAFDGVIDGTDSGEIHHYGAHIFHTVSDKVWNYLSQFTRWRPYEHRVLGMVDGKLIPIPFNLTSLHRLLPESKADAIEQRLLAEVGPDAKVPILRLMEHTDPMLRGLGELVYEKIFANYTAKQWGLGLDELDRSVGGRVPVVVSHDDRYFHDRHQAMPAEGYAKLFERLLDHPNISVELGVDYGSVVSSGGALGAGTLDAGAVKPTIYTGPIDEYFGYCYGPLPYRSLRFEHYREDVDYALPVAVVNHPAAEGYTRVIEHKHLTCIPSAGTVLTREWPEEYVVGRNDPYYPIMREDNRLLHARYLDLAAREAPHMHFAGRLADYKYYNMDQAVSRALLLFRQIAGGEAAAA